jgi:phosphoglycerate dehydrogenase-like enzyme
VSAATENGVYVIAAPGGNAASVAEYVISVSLLARRRLGEAAAKLRSSTWQEVRGEGYELFEKGIGIVEFGTIGSRVARIAEVFGIEVLIAAIPSPIRLPVPNRATP